MTSEPKPPRRSWLPRYRLRTLLIITGILAIVFSYAANRRHRVQHQRSVVRNIVAARGQVGFDYQLEVREDLDFVLDPDRLTTRFSYSTNRQTERTRITSSGQTVDVQRPPGPWVLRRLFGDDLFANVEKIDFAIERSPRDFDLRLLSELPHLKIASPFGPQVNDHWLRALAKVPELRVLTLLGNARSSATAEGLASLQSAKKLKSLGLAGDWLTDETASGVAGLTHLESLSFSGPNLTAEVFSHLEGLSNLRELIVMQGKKIDDRGIENLCRLTSLRTLYLQQSPITDLSLSHLEKLPHLQWLNLSGTAIGDAGMEHLAALPNLKRLTMRSTQVGDAGLVALSRAPQLRYLDLAGTQITDAGLPTLARMPQLVTLDLEHTAITDAGLQHLATLKNLRYLTLGPHTTEAEARKLKQSLPHCETRGTDPAGNNFTLK